MFNEQDVQVAAQAEQHQQQCHPQGMVALHGAQLGAGINGSAAAFNFIGTQQQRRTQLAQQGLTGMGGMGGNIRPPGAAYRKFKLIFSRLQGELQKIEDTGAELQNLTSALGEIQDMLGGALVHVVPFVHEFYVDTSVFSCTICLLHLTRSFRPSASNTAPGRGGIRICPFYCFIRGPSPVPARCFIRNAAEDPILLAQYSIIPGFPH